MHQTQSDDGAAEEIADEVERSVIEAVSKLAEKYDIDYRLLILTVTKAAVKVAAGAASSTGGFVPDEVAQLERRIHKIVFRALNGQISSIREEHRRIVDAAKRHGLSGEQLSRLRAMYQGVENIIEHEGLTDG